MCGIAGISGKLDVANLNKALAALGHRGPDDSGLFQDPLHNIGLVHSRLSILDLSPLGHQPMQSDDGKVVLVFNGEIYNFRELRNELEASGFRFRGNSDTEVLLCIYLEYRIQGGDVESMLRRLNGILAFALWDSDSGALLIARDALGVKPLYFRESDGNLIFASEIKALRPLGIESDDDLDVIALHRYLSFLWCPGERTPLKAVKKLGPGELIWVRDGKIEKKLRWYRLPVFRRRSSPISESDAIVGTTAHLRDAVRRQMISDVPVGAFLSGGLDSCSIVVFAREHNPDIRCFTIESDDGQEDGTTDDLPYARRVAAHLNIKLDIVRIDATQMAQDLEKMVVQLDEPLADPAPLNVLYISRLARNHGIKVLLSGAGGDDIFTGYRRHRAVQAERYWTWLPRCARIGLERLTKNLDQRAPAGRRLRKLFSGAGLNGDARLVNYFLWSARKDLIGLYTQSFLAALGDAAAETPILEFLSELPADVEPLERMLATEQRFFLTDHNLTYTDKMSMAVGLEVRVPFLDLELVDFAASIPIGLKQRGAEGKWILKKAMEPYLPHDVIYRPKSGFGAPIRRWMRFELRELLGDILSVESLQRRGLFDAGAVQRLIAANDSGEVDASYTLLSLLAIEIWCRTYRN